MTILKRSTLILATIVLCQALYSAHAEVAVVAHPSYLGTSISKTDLAKLYLGRSTSFPGGATATPIDMGTSPVRDEFLSKYLEKTDAQMTQLWVKLVFSGNAKSLEKVSGDTEMLARVARDKTAIGFVDAKSVNDSVKRLNVE